MSGIENIVTWTVMLCALLGALAAIRDSEMGLGKQFMEGLHSIGPIFIPVAGIMAAVPYLSRLVSHALGPGFYAIGADPSVAATTLIAVDMGGYKLAEVLASSKEDWIVATIVGYMAGATIIFSIPVGLAMLQRRDHKYMALGIMSGILSVPIGVAVSCLLVILLKSPVRDVITTNGDANYALALTGSDVLINLVPLILFVVLVAAGLRIVPDLMIRTFILFGRLTDASIKLVLVSCIIEYFTQAFSRLLAIWDLPWEFAPIIADEKDQFRALEIAGYIGIMLAGAFPMVYLIRKYFGGPIESAGRRIGLEREGAAGLLATVANVLAMYKLVEHMRPKDKVVNISFAVCAAFLLGDHLAFTANFQPTLVLPIIVGKLVGGAFGIAFAYWLSVPKALALERIESSAVHE